MKMGVKSQKFADSPEELLKIIKEVWRKHGTKLLIVSIFSALILIKLVIYNHQQLDRYEWNKVTEFLEHPAEAKAEQSKNIKHILFWTNFYESEFWYMGKETQSEDYLKAVNCPVTNCILTHNRNLLPSPTDYDALVFHVGESFDIYDMPSARTENQVYVMADQESPIYTKHNLDYDKNFFNMTLTYRLDSDIYWGYTMIADIESGSVVAPSRNVKWREPETVTDPEILKAVKSKNKMAAWFVSHCGAFSNRDKLAQKLQQYVDVDIYGKCGNLSCPREQHAKCTQMLNTTYKFYLAFENSICADYLSEKGIHDMDKYIVPIVYNGASDMLNFLPPHSYISVNDFEDVEELANYLKFLDENPEEYANYFWWKKYYKIMTYTHPHSCCQMCLKLNEWDTQRKKQQYYDIAHWFNHKTCTKPKSQF